MAEQRITFRRIRGRLVPIKLKGFNARQKKGAGLVAGGTAVALAAGIASSKVTLRSARIENVARRFNKLGRAAKGAKATKLRFRSFKFSKISSSLFKSRIPIRQLGLIGGSILIGTGIERLLPKTQDVSTDIISQVVGTAAAVALNVGIIRGLRKGKIISRTLERLRQTKGGLIKAPGAR